MQLGDLISLIRTTVVKQLVLDDADIISFIDTGLTALYKRFDIAVREEVLDLNPTINEYYLNKDCMVILQATTQEKYLKDKYGKLLNTTVSSDSIVEIPINDANDVNSVYTPEPNVVQVLYPSEGQNISLIYRAAPNSISSLAYTDDIALPPQYVEPLMFYVGFMAYLGQDSSLQKDSDGFFLRYTNACNTIDTYGLTNDEVTTNNKLSMRGFV